MKRKITREIFLEIETVRVTKKYSARKKSAENENPDISVELCRRRDDFGKNGEHSENIFGKSFFKENLK